MYLWDGFGFRHARSGGSSFPQSSPSLSALIAVVPFRGQNSRWNLAEQQRYDHILAKADKVIVLSDTYYKGCLLRRNDFMLQHSNFVIAYYDGKQKGGTYYTCREARKRGMTVVNLF